MKEICDENGIALQDFKDKGYTFGHTWIYRWRHRVGVANPK